MGILRSSPKASPKKTTTTLRYLFDLDSRNKNSAHLFLNNTLRHQLFDSKDEEVLSLISFCSFTYTFTDPLESPSQQDLKHVKLLQLLSILRPSKKPPADHILSSLFDMLSSNLFRGLPPPNNNSVMCILPEDDELVATPIAAWPHLRIVYDILLQLISDVEAKALRNYIDHSFILNLLSLFQSEDPRERESLKNAFHQIYSNFAFYRAFMRKAMNDVFLHYVFETDQRHYAIGDLLEIWGSIINGFAVPLKEEHRCFLKRVLIPLHKPKGLQSYHRQLAYCVSQFVQKEPELAGDIIRGILRYWPVTNCQKEILLISELEELVESIDPQIYKKVALPLCSQIAKCLNSCNSQVAERALYLWNNEQFVNMASQEKESVYPIMVRGMEKNLKWHWSNNVRQLTESVRVMLEETEPYLYSKCLFQLQLQESAAQQEEIKRKERWAKIEEEAAKKMNTSNHHIVHKPQTED